MNGLWESWRHGRKHATYVPGKRDKVGPGCVDVEVGVQLLFEGHLGLLWTEE